MKDFRLIYRHFSKSSILIEWPQEINEIILNDVLIFKNYLLNLNIKSIVQINSAYNSILIIYNGTIDNAYDEILTLKSHYDNRKIQKKLVTKLFEIPVCYDDEFGLDLDEISEEKKISKLEIIKLHAKPFYTVYFIGFLPGFLYLGGLDEGLEFPRKKSPRRDIKRGAVAIGGSQTGIYPNVSPGGWNIIGNSPVEFFNPNKKEPCFAKSGDKIKFIPIPKLEYNAIAFQITQGIYDIQTKIIDG